MAVEPIPQEELKAAREKLCRRIGAVIAYAIAQTNTSPDLIDTCLGKSPGYTLRFVRNRLKGKDTTLAPIAEILFAMGCELKFTLAIAPTNPDPEDGG